MRNNELDTIFVWKCALIAVTMIMVRQVFPSYIDFFGTYISLTIYISLIELVPI